MRIRRQTSCGPMLALVLLLSATAASGAVSPITPRLFEPVVGDVAGDTNADGRATAADLVGKVLGWANPTEDGPYGSGWRRLDLSKPSETNPEVTRRLLTSVWYPAAPGTFPSDSLPGGNHRRRLPRRPKAHGLCCSFPTARAGSTGNRFSSFAAWRPGDLSLRHLPTRGTQLRNSKPV